MKHSQPSDPTVVPVRDAATVMVVRDRSAGVEVALLRRSPRSGFVADAHVFPGGAVDQGDAAPDVSARCRGLTDSAASEALGVLSGGLAYWVAAVRECFEESGILLADHAGAPVDASVVDADRADVDSGRLDFAEFCARHDLTLATDRIRYVTRWVTPLGAPRRYDTRFFVAPAPSNADLAHDGREAVASGWWVPADALAGHRRGEMEMILPTVRSLEWLGRFASVREVMEQPDLR